MPKINSPLTRFREAKQEVSKSRQVKRKRTLVLCGALLAILIPVISVGVITEKRDEAKTAAITATQTPPASEPAASQPPPAAGPSESQDEEEPTEYDANHLQFGQTGRYIHGFGRPYPEVPLEFTVSAPTPFTPSKRAKFVDVYGFPYGGKGPRQPANVYFTVTVKNVSMKETYDVTVTSEVDDSGDDEEQSYVEDGDIGMVRGLGDEDGDIRPGKSATVKDGWSLKSADNIRYELRFDGVGGESFYFTK